MKKQKQLLIAAGLLALASSCNTGSAGDPAADEARIDSMANARLETLRMELMAQNDSLIMVMAREKADSMLVAMGKPAAVKKVVPKRTLTTRDKGTATTDVPAKTTDEPTVPTTTGKKGGQDQGTTTGKKGGQDQGTTTGKR